MYKQPSLPARVGTLIVLIMLATVARATEWECGERSNLSAEGKNYCAAGDFRQAEKKLSNVFAVALEKHKTVFKDAADLSDAQSTFLSYRDNQCAAENRRIEEKPYHPMVVAQCKTRLTNIRIDELLLMIDRD